MIDKNSTAYKLEQQPDGGSLSPRQFRQRSARKANLNLIARYWAAQLKRVTKRQLLPY